MVRRSCTLLFLVFVVAACERGAKDFQRINFSPATPTPYPTPTERIVVHTSTPLPTLTPVFVQITTTPQNTVFLCVSASETVYLRPSPSVDNYPVMVLKNGEKLTDLGGQDGNWLFVQSGDKRGWVNGKYVLNCK